MATTDAVAKGCRLREDRGMKYRRVQLRRRIVSFVMPLIGFLVFLSTANAQVYYSHAGSTTDAQKKAVAESRANLKYDPHDLSVLNR